MISISNTNKYFFLAFFVGVSLLPHFACAQEQMISQTLSVSPTLFEMQANPSQSWTSTLRVINVNDYPLTVYPQPVNFASNGEDGRGDLLPIFSSETQGKTLAEWITVPTDPVIIEPQGTAEIPVAVKIPDDASPGGHYAAILVGTKPPVETSDLSQVQTAQFVTALFFVRIAGDVIEAGDIREFTAEKAVVKKPEVSLSMRFENTGNVHVQPQGDIKIFNMWGKERGYIPINQQTHFGNVLPQSIRKFSFTWTGDTGAYDIGRYKAVATLGYGDDGKKFVTSTTYFWVIPYTTILVSLLILFIGIKISLWLIRRYINRMLALSGVNIDAQPYIPQHARKQTITENTVIIKQYSGVSAPVRASAQEIINNWRRSIGFRKKLLSLWQYVMHYRWIFIGLLIVVAVLYGSYLALQGIFKNDAHYEVSISNSGTDMVMSSEDIAYQKLRQAKIMPEATGNQPATIKVVNVSGEAGLGAQGKFALEEALFSVESLTVDEMRTDAKTSIIYPVAEEEFALQLRAALGVGLLSAQTDQSETAIIINIGKDSRHQ